MDNSNEINRQTNDCDPLRLNTGIETVNSTLKLIEKVLFAENEDNFPDKITSLPYGTHYEKAERNTRPNANAYE
jgi:hypothetical protein